MRDEAFGDVLFVDPNGDRLGGLDDLDIPTADRPVERVEDLVPGQADPLEAAGLRDPDGLEVFIVTSGHGLSLD